MKTVKKNVYYCDFCGKRKLSASHMKIHEKHCTANPNRICRLCEVGVNVGEIVTELKKRFELKEVTRYHDDYIGGQVTELKAVWIGEPITMNEVCNLADDCPNCKLAIIRQTGLSRYYFNDENGNNQFSFNYKAESKDAIHDKNRELHEHDYYFN
jgi:hypothetical protein